VRRRPFPTASRFTPADGRHFLFPLWSWSPLPLVPRFSPRFPLFQRVFLFPTSGKRGSQTRSYAWTFFATIIPLFHNTFPFCCGVFRSAVRPSLSFRPVTQLGVFGGRVQIFVPFPFYLCLLVFRARQRSAPSKVPISKLSWETPWSLFLGWPLLQAT